MGLFLIGYINTYPYYTTGYIGDGESEKAPPPIKAGNKCRKWPSLLSNLAIVAYLIWCYLRIKCLASPFIYARARGSILSEASAGDGQGCRPGVVGQGGQG